MTLAARTFVVPRWRIQPLHGVRDESHRDRIAISMAREGWTGRPLLVIAREDGKYQALTGSHRFGAATEIELDELPVVLLSGAALLRALEAAEKDDDRDPFGELLLDCDDYARLRAIRDCGDDVAAALMLAEVHGRLHGTLTPF